MSLSKFMCSKIGAFIIVLPFIKPAQEILGAYNGIFNIWKVISIFLIFISVKENNKKLFSSPIIIIFLIQVVYFISTCFSNGDIKTAIGQMLSNISICMYMIYLYKKDEFLAIRNFSYPTVFMASLTAFTMFIYYPHGMYQIANATYTEASNYLWGFDNTSGLLFVSTVFFVMLYSMYVNKPRTYIRTFCIISFFLSAFIYVQSITAYLMISFELIIYIFVVYFRMKLKEINPKKIILFIIMCFTILIAFNQYFTIIWEWLADIGKFYSIKARFIFYNNEFSYIVKSPLWGYGIEDKKIIIQKLGIDHPHNYFMDLLYRGGAIAFSMVLFFFHNLIKNGKIKDTISVLTSCCLFSILLLAMLDFYNEKYLFYPQMVLVYYLITDRKYILKKKDIYSGIRIKLRSEKKILLWK